MVVILTSCIYHYLNMLYRIIEKIHVPLILLVLLSLFSPLVLANTSSTHVTVTNNVPGQPVFLAQGLPAPAGPAAPAATPTTTNPAQTQSSLFGMIYNLLFPIAIVYGVFEIIIAGYRIMTSEGDPRKLEDAKAHLTDSIVGILFVMLAVTILRVIIKSFLGQTL
jgi:hypothetical protein